MLKPLLTASALAAVMMTAVFAQTTTPTTPPSAKEPTAQMPAPAPQAGTTMNTATSETFLTQQAADEWRATKLVGTTVTGPDNASIGDVNDLVLEGNGTIKAVVIGVGGFLGIGEKNIAVPFKSLVITHAQDSERIGKVSATFTKDQLTNAPTFQWYTVAKKDNATEKRTQTAPSQ
jgi:hypothetical protein